MTKITRKKKLWITWEYQVRNRSMARKLNVPLIEIVHNERSKLRYLKCVFQTVAIIHKNKPSVVFHQSPSIILALLISVLKPVYRFNIVIDCHNAGYRPLEGSSKLLNCIAEFSLKRADLVLVHNELVDNKVKRINANRIIVPDPLPEVLECTNEPQVAGKSLVFICRWSMDEPYNEVIEAARILLSKQPELKIFITGKPPKELDPSKLPENIQLTGFLSNQDYANLLHNADLLMALTTRSDSLNCAGYEAMSYTTPMILSNSLLLQQFFNQGYQYTSNQSADIANNVLQSMEQLSFLKNEIKAKKQAYEQSFDQLLAPITKFV